MWRCEAKEEWWAYQQGRLNQKQKRTWFWSFTFFITYYLPVCSSLACCRGLVPSPPLNHYLSIFCSFCFVDFASRYIRVMKTNSVYFVNQPLHVLGISAAHHQEVHCIYTTVGTCCAFQLTDCWPADSQLDSTTCTNCCMRVGTLIVATIYLQLIQNRYMFQSFTVLQCSHQHCVQHDASDVEVVGYL